jgi:hypothetical protein
MAAGLLGGLALLIAAWLSRAGRATLIALAAVGTIPFAILAWTALVPLLLTLAAILLLVPVLRPPARYAR